VQRYGLNRAVAVSATDQEQAPRYQQFLGVTMRNLDEASITQAVLARNSGTADPRLCEIMTSLVQHLHAFARDIRLTEEEWQSGMDFLAEAAAICSSDRQEFLLLSHTLGLSTLVVAQNSKKRSGGTEATAIGSLPLPSPHLHDLGADISAEGSGVKCHVSGTVRDIQGNPVPGASIQVCVASDGACDQALLQADHLGEYHFWTVLPDSQPIQADGPVGALLAALNRHAWRPAHMQFTLRARGYQTLSTQVFREGDAYLDTDAVFGVRSSLIAQWLCHEPGPAADGSVINETFYSLNFNFVLTSQ
jgi:hydroxyquinol 1,2-dioxygenase